MRIGIFVGDIYQKYESIVIRTMEKYALSHGITLDIFGSFAIPDNNVLHAEGEKSILYLPKLEDLDGIIAMGDTMERFGMNKEMAKHLNRAAKCPIVSLRAREKGWYNILADNENAMYEMTRHFIEKHHFRNICFVTGRMTMEDAKERLAGYKKAMAEAGIKVTENMVYYGDYWNEHGREIVDFFLNRKEGMPSAIICSNDYMALSVCDELKKRGIKIPEEICVSGFDNLEEGQMYDPSLTSVSVPFEEMAERALETAVSLAKGETIEKEQYFYGKNQYRQSCGCKEHTEQISPTLLKEENAKIHCLAKECIYMSTDFESALNEKECLEWAADYVKKLDVKNCFICLNQTQEKKIHEETEHERKKKICLRHYMDGDGRSVFVNIPFSRSLLLPKRYLPILNDNVNLFIPLHCKNEIYGYFIFQMEDKKGYAVDERFEFFCMNMGNSLKKVYMYCELFSAKDVMQLYLKDPLTNIYNRRGFERKLVEICEFSKNRDKTIAVVSIDMDGLKYINDTFGHMTGDESLICFSKCLTSVLDKGEFCARMGGDEFFAVLIMDDADREKRFKRQLSERIKKENRLIKEDYVLDASVGICVVEDPSSIMEYLHMADQRMYENKRMKKKKQDITK